MQLDETHEPIQTAIPDQVVVLLGASNLSLAWPRLMATVCARFSGTTHVYTAHGMGRSYLFPHSVFGVRRLPGIFVSGLWGVLPRGLDGRPTFALITDLGNDLLYGSSAADVAESAEESIRRLRNWSPNCKIVVTRPPVDAVNNLGRLRFFLARTLLFPFTKLTVKTAKSETAALDSLLREIAVRQNVSSFQPRPEWYGVDPIHIRRRHQKTAFKTLLDEWRNGESVFSNLPTALKKRPLAEKRWKWGKEKRTAQPVLQANGVSVFAY